MESKVSVTNVGITTNESTYFDGSETNIDESIHYTHAPTFVAVNVPPSPPASSPTQKSLLQVVGALILLLGVVAGVIIANIHVVSTPQEPPCDLSKSIQVTTGQDQQLCLSLGDGLKKMQPTMIERACTNGPAEIYGDLPHIEVAVYVVDCRDFPTGFLVSSYAKMNDVSSQQQFPIDQEITSPNCNPTRSDFLELFATDGRMFCFANRGQMDVFVKDVYQIRSGHNAVVLRGILLQNGRPIGSFSAHVSFESELDLSFLPGTVVVTGVTIKPL